MRSYRFLLLTSFLADLALPIFYTYLPLLGYQLGANSMEIGFIGGAPYAIYCFLPAVIGHFSDKLRIRSILLILAFLIISTDSILYVFVSNSIILILLRVSEGIGWSLLWPSIDAAISQVEIVDSKTALGTYNFVWSAGAALGPIVGGFIVLFSTLRVLCFATSIILITGLATSIVSIISRVENRDNEKKLLQITSRATDRSPYPVRSKSLYVAATFVGAVIALTSLTFFPPYAKSLGLPIVLIGVATFCYGAGRFLIFLLASKPGIRSRILSSEHSRRNVLIGLGVASFATLLFTIHAANTLYFIAFILIGMGYSSVISITQVALIAEVTPAQTGTGAGLFESSIGAGSFIGPVIAGLISHGSFFLTIVVPIFCYFSLLTVSLSFKEKI